MRRLLALAFLAAMLVGVGTVQAAPSSNTVATLKLYQRTNQSIMAVTEAGIKRFNASYPNVKVETQWQPLGSWGEYISGFLNQVGAGSAPDRKVNAKSSADCLVNLPVISPESKIWLFIYAIDLTSSLSTTPMYSLTCDPVHGPNLSAPDFLSEKAI